MFNSLTSLSHGHSNTGGSVASAAFNAAYAAAHPAWPSGLTPSVTTFLVGTNGYTNSANNRLCGSNDGVYRFQCGGGVSSQSTDSGATWSSPPLPASTNCTTCACSSTGQYVLFCAASGGAMQLSTNYGTSYTTITGTGLPTAFTRWACNLSDDGQKILIGYSSGCACSVDGGSTWTTVVSGDFVFGTSLSADGQCAAVGRWAQPYMTLSFNGMSSWTQVGPSGGQALQCRALVASSNNDTLFANNTSHFLHFRGMATSTRFTNLNAQNLFNGGNLLIVGEYVPVGGSQTGNVLVVLDTGNATNNAWYSCDRGTTWRQLGTDVSAAASYNWNNVWVSPNGRFLAVSNSTRQVLVDFGQAI